MKSTFKIEWVPFKRNEFTCQCGCGFDTVDVDLLKVLTAVRNHFNAPVTITSGCRCISHNNSIGGAMKSTHLRGQAADFRVKGVHADDVADFLEKEMEGWGGIGRYTGRTHVDVRSNGPARWDNRGKY